MSKSALHALSQKDHLEAAWLDLFRSKKRLPSFRRPDLKGESLESFERRRDQNIKELAADLRHERYVFHALEPIFVPKADGKLRLICVPTVRDRLVQRAIVNLLRPRSGWMANGVSFGFVPDRSVVDAVDLAARLRSKSPWVFKTDITAFFDNIDRTLLWERVVRRVRHPSLWPLLRAAMGCEIHASGDAERAKIKRVGIRVGRGVRQGMPLSPYFANVMLEPFDQACAKAELNAIRYADDLAFFADTKSLAEQCEDFCRTELERLSLGIPELGLASKTRIYSPQEPADFLGVEIAIAEKGYQLRVSPKQMDVIKGRIHALGNLKELRERGLDITRFGSALSSTVRSFAAAYEHCSNMADLQQHLDACRSNAVRSAVKSLGVDLDRLSGDARWFLGLAAPQRDHRS